MLDVLSLLCTDHRDRWERFTAGACVLSTRRMEETFL